MWDTVSFVAILTAQAIIGFLIWKLIPKSLNKYIEKEIDRRSDVKLEKVKAEIEGSYSTLKSSADIFSNNNSDLRPHIIDSVSEIWEIVIALKDSYNELLFIDSIFLQSEIDEAFKDQHKHIHERLLSHVEKYRVEINENSDNNRFLDRGLEKHRLFCGDRLWLIFFVIRSVYLRTAMLITRSFQSQKHHDWQKDDGVLQLLNSVASKEFVEEVSMRPVGGLQAAIDHLEAQFLHEASRVMSGSKAIADSLADYQSVLLLENAKIAERGK